MFMSEAGKISQKIKVWFSDYSNISDFVAMVSFFIGFGLRLGGSDTLIFGRTVYCLNIIFWYVRLLDILAVNQQAGPYVMMIAKMVSFIFFEIYIWHPKILLCTIEEPSLWGQTYMYAVYMPVMSAEHISHETPIVPTG